jgi:hypothetical protein
LFARRHRDHDRPHQFDCLRMLALQCPGLITRFIRVAFTLVWTHGLSRAPEMQAMGSLQPGSLVGSGRSVWQIPGRALQLVRRREGCRCWGFEKRPCAVS